MIEALNRTRGRAARDGGQFHSAPPVDQPDAQPLLAEIGRNISPFSTVDRVEHAKNIAAVVIQARQGRMR